MCNKGSTEILLETPRNKNKQIKAKVWQHKINLKTTGI
jgi:hypothetical protein